MTTTKKVIQDSKKIVSDEELLMKQLNEFSANKLAESITNQSIWKQIFKDAIMKKHSKKTETGVRGVIRDKYQIPLSKKVIQKNDNPGTLPESLEFYCKDLQEFYKMSLVEFSKYSNVRESSKNYKTIHNAYSIMKKTLKLS